GLAVAAATAHAAGLGGAAAIAEFAGGRGVVGPGAVAVEAAAIAEAIAGAAHAAAAARECAGGGAAVAATGAADGLVAREGHALQGEGALVVDGAAGAESAAATTQGAAATGAALGQAVLQGEVDEGEVPWAGQRRGHHGAVAVLGRVVVAQRLPAAHIEDAECGDAGVGAAHDDGALGIADDGDLGGDGRQAVGPVPVVVGGADLVDAGGEHDHVAAVGLVVTRRAVAGLGVAVGGIDGVHQRAGAAAGADGRGRNLDDVGLGPRREHPQARRQQQAGAQARPGEADRAGMGHAGNPWKQRLGVLPDYKVGPLAWPGAGYDVSGG